MNKKLALISALLAGSLVASCVQVPSESPTANKKNNVAVSSVRDIPLSFPQGSKFSLAPKYVKKTSLQPSETQAVYSLYANAIVNDLINNGFINTEINEAVESNSLASEPVFHVGFGVALSSDLSDQTINEKFGVSPGLPQSDGLEKGSFLIYIEDAQTGARVWRGAAQGFVHQQLSKNERELRAQNIVSSVMAQFYATN